MSYSTDLKTYLTAIETKRQCCRDAYECGVNLRPYESVCAQDTGAWLRGAFCRLRHDVRSGKAILHLLPHKK